MGIKLGLNNITSIKGGSTIINKVMVGATLLWQLITDLITQYQNRISSDGGTYVDNSTSTEIVYDPDLTLLLTPNGYKAGKLYSALPDDGSGDFIVDGGGTPVISNSTIVVGADIPYTENLYKYNSSSGTGGKWNTSLTADAATPPNSDITYVWKAGAQQIRLYRSDGGIPATGGFKFKMYSKKANYPLSIQVNNGTSTSTPTNTVTDVGGGWWKYYASIPSNVVYIHVILETDWLICGVQITNTFGALEYDLETTGTARSRALIPGDIITTTTPVGTQVIEETVNGFKNSTTTIPTTYQLPIGNINMVKMYTPSYFETETITYINRVISDGGVVMDATYIDSIYKKLKTQGTLSSLQVWGSANAGYKISGTSMVKLYSLDLNANDIIPSPGFAPSYATSSINPNRKTVVYNSHIMYANLTTPVSTSSHTFFDYTVYSGALTRNTTIGVSALGGLTWKAAEINHWFDSGGRSVYYNGDGTDFAQVFLYQNYVRTTSTVPYLTSARRSSGSIRLMDGTIDSTQTIPTDYIVNADKLVLGNRQHDILANPLAGEMSENIYFSTHISDVHENEIRTLINNYYA